MRSMDNTHQEEAMIYNKDEEIARLRDELISMTKICEDVLNDKDYKFPKTSEQLLREKIEYAKKTDFILYIKPLLDNIRIKNENKMLNEDFIQHLASAVEEIGFVDSDWYFECNKDVAASGYTAGYHYIMWGQYENRSPNPNLPGR